ncbi:MAG: glycosyltransferase [Phycisphaerales bacterium]|nr:MAG: glycosyltransferase [Phycisphaerales bacterium]
MATTSPDILSGASTDRSGKAAPQRFDGIICFGGEDWWYHNHGHYDMQMMRQFSRSLPVLFVNSLGMRTPSPGEGRMFLTRVRRKLRSMRRGLSPLNDGFAVFSPVLFPSRIGMKLTRPLLTSTVKSAAGRLGISRPLIWVTCPTAAEAVDALDPQAVVYQRTDRYECYQGVDAARIRNYDTWLKARADLTVFCSTLLFREERRDCRAACYVDHGVDFDRFVSAADQEAPDPDDMATIPHPRIGFIGGIDAHTFDPDLFIDVARRLPEASFVLVGSCSLPPGWCELDNVITLGQKRYEDVPRYMSACDVLIMPWNRSRWIEACNPIKLKEYLATGRPIVSTDFPELRRYERTVGIALDADDFANKIQLALREPGDPQPGRDRVRRESWASRARAILDELAARGLVAASQAAEIPSVPESAAMETEPKAASAALKLAPEPAGTNQTTAWDDLGSAPELSVRCATGADRQHRQDHPTPAAIGQAAEPDRDPSPIVDLAACIILVGGLRPSPLVQATGRSVLDLWLTPTKTVLDCWVDRITEAVAGASPPIRVVHDSMLPPPWPSAVPGERLIIEHEPQALRGPAGVVRDLCVDYSPDEHVLVMEAARYAAAPLAPMLREHFAHQADITVASCSDGSPAGIYLIRCGTLDLVPMVGFTDLKEQWLRRAIGAGLRAQVHRLHDCGTLPLRTRKQFLAAARTANGVGRSMNDVGMLVGGLITAGRPTGLRVICAGSVMGPGATIVDSIVMPGAVVGPKSIVVRSLLCPDSQIQAGADIADAVVYAGGCLSDDGRACA